MRTLVGASAARHPEFLKPDEWNALALKLNVSNRERQVLEGILRGELEDVIASSLGLSPATVHTYMRRIYSKLGVRTRVAAVVRIFALYAEVSRSAAVHRGRDHGHSYRQSVIAGAVSDLSDSSPTASEGS